ncbi:MAG: NUDIX domain-containing protein [Nanoarchaeota archaeon]|nr:NUDIX domain-containing protein [Nanoarchaeota archaeon]
MDDEKVVCDKQISCDKDKAHYVVATCIIVKDGKYLIAKRSMEEKAFPGKWTVPGGKLETRDYINREYDTPAGKQWYNVIEDLVKREVREEVSLEIGSLGYVTSLTFIRHDGIPTLVISLFASHSSGDVVLSDELTEYKWVTLEEAKNYDLIDGIYEELEILDGFLKSGEGMCWKKQQAQK